MTGEIRHTPLLALRRGSKMRLEKVAPLLLFVVSAAGGLVSALTLVEGPQKAWDTVSRVLGPGEDRRLRANVQTLHTIGLPDARNVSSSFSEANWEAKRLQAVLDKLCKDFFNDLCTLGVQQFCNGDAVARYGPGKPDAEDLAWRCYAGKTLENSEAKMQCTDDCGYTFPCKGQVNSDSLFLTMERALQDMPGKIALRTCPKSQRALNLFCSTFGEDHVARFSSTPKSSTRLWRCFKKTTLLFNQASECGGHCKDKLVACPGGVPPDATGEDVLYYSRDSELQSALKDVPDPCPGQTCRDSSTQAVCS